MKTIKDAKGNPIEVPSNIVSIQPDESSDKDFDRYPNNIPVGRTVSEIVRVEQEFDRETVPIRRIEAMQLGKIDSRYEALGLLKTPLSPPFAKVDTAAATGSSTVGSLGGMPGPDPGGSSKSGGAGRAAAAPEHDGSGRPRGAGDNPNAGGGPLSTVIDENRNRYVDVTEQVRRMPIGIVVVVDQSYIQDVLVAFANSPLRFQITQVVWTRFRGDLGFSGAGDDPFGSGSQPIQQQGQFGSGFGTGGSDPDDRYRRGMMSRPRGPGSSGGPPVPPTMSASAGAAVRERPAHRRRWSCRRRDDAKRRRRLPLQPGWVAHLGLRGAADLGARRTGHLRHRLDLREVRSRQGPQRREGGRGEAGRRQGTGRPEGEREGQGQGEQG